MKVLFAVNNDNISDAILKKYQKNYKEIISYKNVYYFNAILKELQHDKTYDRVVISEDLEPFANNNYDTIDKFLFEKLDRISDEATKANGEDIEIILICTDRRRTSDDMLTKIFGIGIYNALIGEERNIDILCRLLHQPRTKKEAKIAYKIEGNNVTYQAEDENSVSESEIQNILAHYKRLGKNEDKYVDSFNNIVSQYTDTQLKIIIRYLPLHVKAVLEEKSPKYQQLSTFSVRNSKKNEEYKPRNLKSLKQDDKIKVEMLSNEKDKITKPIVIPSTLKTKQTVKFGKKEANEVNNKEEKIEPQVIEEVNNQNKQVKEKRGRGRPRKNEVVDIQKEEQDKPKRGRGRPKKEVLEEEKDETFDIDLFNLNIDEKTTEENKNENQQEEQEDFNFDIFNIDEEQGEDNQETQEEVDLFNIDVQEKKEQELAEEDIDLFNIDTPEENNLQDETERVYNEEAEETYEMEPTVRTTNNLNSLLTNEKKIVSFVGTTKNGTSFIVNNLALVLSSMKISTAILDTTQSKNAYYIFTRNEERLRGIASNCISNLEKGKAEGIVVDKYLTVYTEIPGENKEHKNVENILATLMKKYDVVLIDSDFDTQVEYFQNSQEIYLVQSMDILTIQPLTAFLRNLKSKGILAQEKLKIIINKEQKIKSLSDKILIGGISSYNDPSMSFMTELFNKDYIKYCKIPFEVQNYVKYLDSLVNCEISLRGYTKQLIMALNELAGMVYPLINKSKYKTSENKKERMQFSTRTNRTLNEMRKKY